MAVERGAPYAAFFCPPSHRRSPLLVRCCHCLTHLLFSPPQAPAAMSFPPSTVVRPARRAAARGRAPSSSTPRPHQPFCSFFRCSSSSKGSSKTSSFVSLGLTPPPGPIPRARKVCPAVEARARAPRRARNTRCALHSRRRASPERNVCLDSAARHIPRRVQESAPSYNLRIKPHDLQAREDTATLAPLQRFDLRHLALPSSLQPTQLKPSMAPARAARWAAILLVAAVALAAPARGMAAAVTLRSGGDAAGRRDAAAAAATAAAAPTAEQQQQQQRRPGAPRAAATFAFPRPSHTEHALMCRWLAHTASWGVLSTRDAASGVFGGVVSVSDGFVGNATGRLLFYLTVRQLQEEEEEGWERRWWLPRTGRKVAILHGRLQLWIGSRRLQTQHTTHNTQHTTHNTQTTPTTPTADGPHDREPARLGRRVGARARRGGAAAGRLRRQGERVAFSLWQRARPVPPSHQQQPAPLCLTSLLLTPPPPHRHTNNTPRRTPSRRSAPRRRSSAARAA